MCSVILTAMSIDRFLAVLLPLKAKTMCTIYRAKLTCFVSIVVLGVIHITGQAARSYNPRGARRYCNFNLPGYWATVYYLFTMITTYIIPLIIMFLTNIGIISILASNARQRQALQCGVEKTEKKKDSYITALLLSVSISSIIFLLPNRLTQLYYSYKIPTDQRSLQEMNLLYSITTFILYCNYGMNFYAYTLPIAKFRREFREMISCKS